MELTPAKCSCTVDHDGSFVQVSILKSENAHKRPLVVVHDFAEDGYEALSPLLESLALHGYPVYFTEMRGHGLSSPNLDRITHFHQFATDLLQVAAFAKNQEKSGTPIIIGKGIGATIAAQFAYAFPKMVKAVVLLDLPFDLGPKRPMQQIVIKTMNRLYPRMRLPLQFWPQFSKSSKPMDPLPSLSAHLANQIQSAVEGTPRFLSDSRCPILLARLYTTETFERRNVPWQKIETIDLSHDKQDLHKVSLKLLPWLDSMTTKAGYYKSKEQRKG